MADLVKELQSQLHTILVASLDAATAVGELPAVEIPEYELLVPPQKEFGDYSTNLALLLGKPARKAPRQVAEILLRHIPGDHPLFAQPVQVAGPGFLNFFLKPDWLYAVPSVVAHERESYGHSTVGQGRAVNLEYVSANPTGPLHVGHARGAAVGSVMAKLFRAAGYNLTCEFYINDAGNQIEKFGNSLEVRYRQHCGEEIALPEDGYHGADLLKTVAAFVKARGAENLESDPAQLREALIDFALAEKMDHIRRDLEAFGVTFDVWYSERTLHAGGKVQATVDRLQQLQAIYEKDGALWFHAPEQTDEKDEVILRSNGLPTYFATDIAYHQDKYQRGYDWMINIWGADHHGHVPRMKGAMAALGYDAEKLDVLLIQMVRLLRGGEIVKMSKRTGELVTLTDLLDEVGTDAARFFFAMRNADSQMDFDLDLARSQSSENPVYYVQYAHARICSILRQATEQEILIPAPADVQMTQLTDPSELALLRKLAELPSEVGLAATEMAPHRICRYAMDLATTFHLFYTNCRVLTDDVQLTRSRLVLLQAVQQTLANVLTLIGVQAPERM